MRIVLIVNAAVVASTILIGLVGGLESTSGVRARRPAVGRRPLEMTQK
ncbi:hypothetical protein [Nonomuraea sp. bgisy101]